MPSTRRRFLRDAGCVSLGALAAAWVQQSRSRTSVADAADAVPSPEERVRQLQLELPKPGPPAATLVPAVRTGNLLFVSGYVPRDADGKPIVGKLGRDFDTKQGADAARVVALHVLGVVRAELGSLDRVVRLVKVLGMVNCTPEFTETPQVVNGFSQVLIDVFGEKTGKAARSAVGMASLPSGVPVEVEAIFEVRG